MVSTNRTSEGLPMTRVGTALSEGTPAPRSTEYLTTIGLEVHAQLLTNSKMFCGCSADIAYAPPNTHVCPVCLGMPGTLPVINAEAVRKTLLTGLAVNCAIPPFSKFDRKNYHYPDLMKGYQISQYDLPLCINGYLEIEASGEGSKSDTFRVGIRRVHLEEDTARLLHRTEPNGTPYSLMDVNRAGVPLIEIVSEPDITSLEQAQLYLMHLRHILRWIGVSTGNMEEGSFRVDANVSVRPVGQQEYGTRAEVKNMNSFKAVRSALEFEVERQIGVLESGQKVVQETRGWVEAQGVTVSQRSKEEAHDYRYFPEPDLPPLTFSEHDIEAIRAGLPELPIARRDRFREQYGLSLYDATQLTSSRSTADYFERSVNGLDGEDYKTTAGIMLNDLASLTDLDKLPSAKVGASLQKLADLQQLGKEFLEERDRLLANMLRDRIEDQLSAGLTSSAQEFVDRTREVGNKAKVALQAFSDLASGWKDFISGMRSFATTVTQSGVIEKMRKISETFTELERKYGKEGLDDIIQKSIAAIYIDEFGELVSSYEGVQDIHKAGDIAIAFDDLIDFLTQDQLAELSNEIDQTNRSLTSEQLRELVQLLRDGKINRSIAKQILPLMLETGHTPAKIIEELGLAIVEDNLALEKAVDEAIQGNPKAVADYLGGKESAIAAFLGPIMKATRGQADANATRELLKRKLDALRET